MRDACPGRETGALPTFLLTGFEPFGGDPTNPSWEVARRLDGAEVPAGLVAKPPGVTDVGDSRRGAETPALAVLRAVRLPCVFQEALDVLDEALERYRPVAVIGLGLAASRGDVSIERVAINVDDARIADNAGCRPIDVPVCADGPAAYWSSLPIKAIVAALQESGIAASVSQSAGTFVCNHVFYGLAHRLAGQARARASGGPEHLRMPALPRRGGFIHVPWPSGAMSLDTLVAATRIAAQVTLTAGDADLRLPGGAID